MKRRNFLQTLGAMVFAPALPSLPATAGIAPAVDPVTLSCAKHLAKSGRVLSAAQLTRRFGLNAQAAIVLQSHLSSLGFGVARTLEKGSTVIDRPDAKAAVRNMVKERSLARAETSPASEENPDASDVGVSAQA